MGVLAIGHRGAAGSAPENTMASFAAALELGADGVELDVQLTADGTLVVFHDDRLGRVTAGRGRVADQRFEALRDLDAGSWFAPAFAGERIPRLDEVLELSAGRAVVNVEIKPDPVRRTELAGETVSCVRRHRQMGDVVFSSFDHRALDMVRAASAEARLGVLFMPGRDETAFRTAARLRAENVHPPVASVRTELVERARREGRRVWTWTANHELEIARSIATGVDAVISDFPERVIEHRGLL